ncbi:MAG: hypothetical protein ACJASZ_002481 [Yoonia sp.]|jgi:hypothetical protein
MWDISIRVQWRVCKAQLLSALGSNGIIDRRERNILPAHQIVDKHSRLDWIADHGGHDVAVIWHMRNAFAVQCGTLAGHLATLK